MISARTWKVVLGCSLLVVCYCAALGYYFLDIDNIQCRIRHPTIDTGPAQARFTEYQRAFTSAIQGDQLLRQDQSEEPIEVHIGELYCGCAYGYTVYVYRSQESAERVIERFANDIHVPGWRVRFSNAEWVQYRNADNTVRAKIRIQSERQRLPAVYEVIFSFAEPSHPECHETGE